MYYLLDLKKGQQNCCPFPHKKQKSGKMFLETNPSCGINDEGAFNCFVCGRKFTDENWFTAAYLNVSLKQAEKFNKMLKDSRTFLPKRNKWKTHQNNLLEELKNEDSKHYKYLKELNILDIVEEARLGLYNDHITIPTFYKGQIINICQFCPGEVPKYRNSPSAITGIITTTKSFKQSEDYILLCAGEKDMMLATKHGFNAVSIMGGEKAKPHYYKELFKGKKVYIAYDNDQAGIDGALDLAKWMYNYTTTIKALNVSDVYEEGAEDLKAVVKEDKEDLTDFFNKYGRNDIDLNNAIDNCKWYQPPALENESVMKLVYETEKILKEIKKKLEEDNDDKRKLINKDK